MRKAEIKNIKETKSLPVDKWIEISEVDKSSKEKAYFK